MRAREYKIANQLSCQRPWCFSTQMFNLKTYTGRIKMLETKALALKDDTI